MTAQEPSLEALLGLSVELVKTMKEADMVEAMERHPSGADKAPGEVLTAADRCDHCSAAALYRVAKFDVADRPLAKTLDFCRHSFHKYFPDMVAKDNWKVTGSNPDLFAQYSGGDERSKGDAHA